jgi:hypothetical protein
MARKTSQTSATKRTPKAESAAKGRPPAGLPDEPDAAGVHHSDESGALPAGDGKRVAVLGRSVVSPRVKR